MCKQLSAGKISAMCLQEAEKNSFVLSRSSESSNRQKKEVNNTQLSS